MKWPWDGSVGPTATQLRQRVLSQLNGKVVKDIAEGRSLTIKEAQERILRQFPKKDDDGPEAA